VNGQALPSWLLLLGVASVGLGLALIVFLAVWGPTGRSKLRRRLRNLDQFVGERAAEPQSGSVVMRAALAVSERAVQSPEARGRVEVALDEAAIDLKPAEWVLLRTGSTVAGAFLLAVAMPWGFGFAGGFLGWLLPGLYRRFRAGRRKRRFADLLPESLQLVVGALRSGFSLPQAIDALVREGPEPVSTEIGRAISQVRLGGELEDALDQTAARNGSQDLSFLVMAIRIQREVGGNLSEVMETAVETMRERGRINRHVRALSAEGRLSAYVLVALPVVLAAFMFLVRRDYLRPLYTTPLGFVMLGGGALMLGLGTFWMSRLVKVEV